MPDETTPQGEGSDAKVIRGNHVRPHLQPAKTAMQSGKAKTGIWMLEFEPEKPRKMTR